MLLSVAAAIFKNVFTFESLVPRKGVTVGWEGKWGKVTPGMYQLNLDFLENLISVSRSLVFFFDYHPNQNLRTDRLTAVATAKRTE